MSEIEIDITGWKDFTGLDWEPIANKLKDVLTTVGLEQAVEIALGYLNERIIQENLRDGYKIDYDNEKETYEQMKTDIEEHTGSGKTEVTILSPAPLPENLEKAWTYGEEVPVSILITGAKQSYVEGGSGGDYNRVHIALNNKPISFSEADWVFDADKGELTYSRVFEEDKSPLIRGINVLEVSVIDETLESPLLRQVIQFVVDPSVLLHLFPLEIDSELSLFDASASGDGRDDQEYVTIRWKGDEPLSIKGWRIVDRGGRHTYRFKDLVLEPNSTITLHTGGRSKDDTKKNLHWGRRSTVWNDKGDTIYIIDDKNILRAEYVYRGK